METVVSEMDEGMDIEEKLAEGLRLINESSVSETKKSMHIYGWRHWVSWCGEVGVDPLNAGWEAVLGFVRAPGVGGYRAGAVRSAVGLVYRSMGEASPADDRRLLVALGNKRLVSGGLDSYNECTRYQFSVYRSDYLAWCHLQRREPAPASVEQVVEFLSSMETMPIYALHMVKRSVSLYLTELGYAPIEKHPAVVAWFKELREKRAQGGVEDGRRPGAYSAKCREEWEDWRDAQGIMAGAASVADVLRYLGQYEHQVTAWKRASALRGVVAGVEKAFAAEEVQHWGQAFRARLKNGEVPGVRVQGRLDSVLAEWSAARVAQAGEGRPVPVGLTREEVERRRVGEGRQLSPHSVTSMAYGWKRFTDWRERRGVPLESVEPVHVRVYLEDAARRLMVSSLRTETVAVAFGFNEHGWLNNPALADEVSNYLSDLEVERKEAASQMDPIRLADIEIILESAFQPRRIERPLRTEIRGVLTVCLVKLMFDGLLRGSDASRAKWGDLSRSGDGTGSLLLRQSKTDKIGRGEYTYVSGVALEFLDRLRDLRRFYGKAEGENNLIFEGQLTNIGRLIQQACSAGGLVGRFGTHSMRIGAAQELALAGFSLPMIMLAGRWVSPGEPRRYIRNITVQESAMAQLQVMLAAGERRLGPDARGIDVMSNFDLVRFVR